MSDTVKELEALAAQHKDKDGHIAVSFGVWREVRDIQGKEPVIGAFPVIAREGLYHNVFVEAQ